MGSAFGAQTGAVGLTASTLKGLIYVKAPSGQDVRIKEFSVALDASAAAGGALLEVCRVTTLGTPTASTPTVVKRDSRSGATSGATVKSNITASPPTADVFASYYIAPNGGLFLKQFPLGEEFVVKAGDTNDAFYLRITPASGSGPNCVASVVWEEGA